MLNGKPARLGDQVNESDSIEVKLKGKPMRFVYIAYNKPKGSVSDSIGKDAKGIKRNGPFKDVFPVGGLDKESHGLMILTNDGRVTDRLLSPAYAHEIEYRATTKEKLRSSFKQKMESGVIIGKEKTKKCKIEILNENSFRVVLTEDKRNQIRRMCVALFQEVSDLQRTRIINIRLENLKDGAYRIIDGDELNTFLSELGLI